MDHMQGSVQGKYLNCRTISNPSLISILWRGMYVFLFGVLKVKLIRVHHILFLQILYSICVLPEFSSCSLLLASTMIFEK